jgi:hypothetical protein
MAQLTVYDSEGFEYDRGGRGGQQNEQIRQYFFAGVMIAVDLTRSPKVTGFFRARETDAGRSEQFYARYRADSTTGLLSNFKSSVERWADRNDMTLATDTEDASFFRKLTGSPGDPPGSAFEHHTLGAVLNRGESVRVGVGSDEDALALLQEYVTEHNVSRIAITSDSEGGNLDDFDMVIDRGRYRGIELLGDTEAKVQQVRPEVEDRIVSATIDDVQSQIRELRQKTSIGDAELERRFRDRLSIFSAPGGRGSRGSTGAVRSSQRARSQTTNDGLSIGPLSLSQRSVKVASVVAVIALVLLASGAVAAYLGVLPSAVPFVGGDGSDGGDIDPSLNITDPEKGMNVNGTVRVSGETNAQTVTVYLNSGETELDSTTMKVDDKDEFQTTLDPGGESGPATVVVEAKYDEAEKNKTKKRSITITAEQTSEESNDTSKPSLEITSPEKDKTVDGTVQVTGETNAQNVTIYLNSNGTELDNTTTNVDGQGKFHENLDPHGENGSATVVVEAKYDEAENKIKKRSITITAEQTSEESNDTGPSKPSLEITSPEKGEEVNGSFEVKGQTNASTVSVSVEQVGETLNSSQPSISKESFSTALSVGNETGQVTVVVNASNGSSTVEKTVNVTINSSTGTTDESVSGDPNVSPSVWRPDATLGRPDLSAPVRTFSRQSI